MLKLGIFGVDKFSEQYINVIKNNNDIELAGIFNYDISKTSLLADKYSICRYSDIETLINVSDAIISVTDIPSSIDDLFKILRKSKHLLIDKINIYSKFEIEDLIKLSNEANVIVQYVNKHRFNNAFIKAQEFFNKPVYIENHHILKHYPSLFLKNFINEFVIYDIDIILSVINSNIKKVQAFSTTIYSESTDLINVYLEFDNGSVANITCGTFSLSNVFQMTVLQKNTQINIDFINQEVKIIKQKNHSNNNLEEIILRNNTELNSYLKEQLIDFSNTIITNNIPQYNLDNFLNSLIITDIIKEKIRITSNQI
ncbi:MAG: hypothetical protein KAT68_00175 [Bacteroidales bacterium]|nr:hypothetical protein [Bacteroidales bacterium]